MRGSPGLVAEGAADYTGTLTSQRATTLPLLTVCCTVAGRRPWLGTSTTGHVHDLRGMMVGTEGRRDSSGPV